jgi:hypothetical protein
MAKIGVLIQLPNSICNFFSEKKFIAFKMNLTKKKKKPSLISSSIFFVTQWSNFLLNTWSKSL